MTATRVVGLGAGGHAKVMIEALRLAGGVEIVALLDANPSLHGTRVAGVEVLGGDERLDEIRAAGTTHAFIGVGGARSNEPRRAVFERARAHGFSLVTAVHPSAVVSASASLGEGAAVLARAVVNADAVLGRNVIVNTAAIVEHDCRVGDHAHIASGARLAGGVTIAAGAHIGLGASVRQGISVGAAALVGAGAVVVDDVPDGAIVVGVPARRLGRSPHGARDLSRFLVPRGATLREAMAAIDANTHGIVLVVDSERRLLGTITDGDIRRAALGGSSLDMNVLDAIAAKPAAVQREPLTAPIGASAADLLELMNREEVRHLPIVDGDRVVDIAFLQDFVKESQPPLRAIVMAGGFGTRLVPLTEKLPKPMLPIGDRPLLEHIVGRLRDAGIRRVHVTTHYKHDVIEEHFRDGRDFGVEIEYVNEDTPLGTAGALGLIDDTREPLLVLNGDIVTRVDFAAMLDFHRTHEADMTVAVRASDVDVPYGVVESDGVMVVRITEKPVLRYFVNAGIYLLNPDVRTFVPAGRRCDMTDVIAALIAAGRRVVSFPVHEYWRDIGEHEAYQQAAADFEKGSM